MINFFEYYNKNGLDNEHMQGAINTAEEIMYNKSMVGKLSPIMHIVKKDRRWAYRYARDVIRGRWLEVEPLILQSPSLTFSYAINVIKGQWPEAEVLYNGSTNGWWKEYCNYFNIPHNSSTILDVHI